MDSRFPTYYMTDRRVMRLTPEQFRFFVMATAWSVSNKTDGQIDREDLYFIPFASEDEPPAMVKLGLWIVNADGWLITDYEKTQTTAAQFETALLNRREADSKRQQRKRETDKGMSRGQSRDGHVTSGGKEEAEERRRKGEAFDEGTPTESQTAQTNPDYCALHGCGKPLTSNQKSSGLRHCDEHWKLDQKKVA